MTDHFFSVKSTATLVIAISIISVTLFGCSRLNDATEQGALNRQFERQFGFPPTNEFKVIHCRSSLIRDTYTVWISFRCNQTGLQKIVGYNYFATKSPNFSSLGKGDSPECFLDEKKGDTPEWWPLLDARNDITIYQYSKQEKDRTTKCFLWYDQKSNITYSYSVFSD